MTDGAKFLFSCFQLNTLNYSNNDGVKNFVWFSSEGDRSLYNKIVPKRAMLRNTRYEDYDPDVFRQIVAFYTNGASLSDSSVRDSGVAAALQSQA
jgi:large subunit ribosomal protein L37